METKKLNAYILNNFNNNFKQILSKIQPDRPEETKEERKNMKTDERLRWGRERRDWVGQQTPRGKLSNYAGSARFVAISRPHGNATFSKSVYTHVNMHAA